MAAGRSQARQAPAGAGSPARLDPAAPAGEHVVALLRRDAGDLDLDLLGTPLGHNASTIHDARVAVRRIRSDLLTFSSLLDPTFVERLRHDLRPLGSALAAIRHLDVVIGYVGRAVADRTRYEPGAIAAAEMLFEQRARAVAAVRELLAGPAGEAIAAGLRRLAAGAPLDPSNLEGREPARDVFPALVRRPWRFVRDAARAAGSDPAPEQVRVWARHCRYAAEAAAPVLGPDALLVAGPATVLHQALGDVNDGALLRRWVATDPAAAHLPPRVARVLADLVADDVAVASRTWPHALTHLRNAKAALRTPSSAAAIRAAGGVVWRRSAGSFEILVIHRVKHGDWSLPKGAAAPGESLEACARREVAEETGLVCMLGPELASVIYRNQDGRRKYVRYWAMEVEAGTETANAEVDAITWLPIADAQNRLTRKRDRRVVGGLLDALESGTTAAG